MGMTVNEDIQATFNPSEQEYEFTLSVKVKTFERSVQDEDSNGNVFNRVATFVSLIPQESTEYYRFCNAWWPLNAVDIDTEIIFINSKNLGKPFRAFMDNGCPEVQERYFGVMSADQFDFFKTIEGQIITITSAKAKEITDGRFGDI